MRERLAVLTGAGIALIAGPGWAQEPTGDGEVVESPEVQSGAVEAPAPAPPSAPAPPPPGPYYTQPPGPYYTQPPVLPPPRLDPTRQRHDGFYLRISLGAGASRGTVEDTGVEGKLSGGGAALDLWLGGTPAAGLVIGGGVSANAVDEPRIELDGSSERARETSWGQGLLGLFVDYYPNDAQGFHFGGMIGAATMTLDNRLADEQSNQNGAGAALFLGYDAWVGDQWSLGGLLRVMATSTTDRDDSDIKGTSQSLSFMLTALHH